MKRKFLLALCICILSIPAFAKNALVVIAHGSPMAEWNAPVLALEGLITKELQQQHLTQFDYVRVALMEYVEPNIATVVADCERENIDSIFAVPAFIAPSSHTELDIPVLLGHKWNAYTAGELAEEGAKLVRSRIPIIEGPTMCFSNVLEDIVTARIQELSTDPANETVVLLGHGDELYEGYWHAIAEAIEKNVREKLGITSMSHAFIEMGQTFAEDMTPVVEAAAKQRKRVLIQGIYLNSNAASMATMWGFMPTSDSIATAHQAKIVWGPDGLLPKGSERVARWAVEQAVNMWDFERHHP